MSTLPSSWVKPPISAVAEVNPRKDVDLSVSDLVSFVPMAAVDEVDGTISSPIDRPYGEVSKGFTHFRDNDVVFAKITPSMENGKSAVARRLTNGTGMGSTEFHVFRSNGAIEPEYLWRFVRQKSFRESAQTVMSGAVGQQRVPADYLKDHLIPLPPLPEQRRIVAKMDGLTACTGRARNELDRIPTLISRYKQRFLEKIFDSVTAAHSSSRLGDLSSFVTSGSRGWAQFYSDIGDLFVRVGNVMRADIKLDLSNVQHVTPPAGAEGRRTQLEPNDLLITITADLGRVGVYDDERTGYINQHVALARLIDPEQARYVAWYLSSELGQAQLLRNTRGATKAGLGLDDIREVTVPIPTIQDQAKIVRSIDSTFASLNRLAAAHAAAAQLVPKLDAAILAKAFRGELVPQEPNDEPASVMLERIKAERETEGTKSKSGRGRKPYGSKAQLMTEKALPPRDRLLKDSEKWPVVGLPFEAIAMRNSMPHDTLRDALFELLSGPAPALQQRFDNDAEVIVIQRVPA